MDQLKKERRLGKRDVKRWLKLLEQAQESLEEARRIFEDHWESPYDKAERANWQVGDAEAILRELRHILVKAWESEPIEDVLKREKEMEIWKK